MLGAVSMRLGREKVRDQFGSAAGPADIDPGSFSARLASDDLELLRRHRLVARDHDRVWSICCSSLAPSIERLVDLVLTTRPAKEAT